MAEHHVTLNSIILGVAVVLLFLNLCIVVFNRGVPNIRTAPAIRKAIIDLLRADMARPDAPVPYTIIDIGSGNGLFTREIARALPAAQIIGVEISKNAVRWAHMMQGREELPNLSYRNVDFFKYDMAQASAVVLFFYHLETVGKKLRAELKPGTLVTSNSFKMLDNWQATEEREVKTLYPFQKKLFVYYSPAPA